MQPCLSAQAPEVRASLGGSGCRPHFWPGARAIPLMMKFLAPGLSADYRPAPILAVLPQAASQSSALPLTFLALYLGQRPCPHHQIGTSWGQEFCHRGETRVPQKVIFLGRHNKALSTGTQGNERHIPIQHGMVRRAEYPKLPLISCVTLGKSANLSELLLTLK